LGSAEAALKDGKYFDGVQFINSCMEEYGKVVGDERIVKDPSVFVKEVGPNLTQDQKEILRRMYEVRGDIITGLGANKRAAVDYECSQAMGGDSGALAEKKSKAEGAVKEQKSADK
ncbi:unnamed protein product, partial [Polarella glacialis]